MGSMPQVDYQRVCVDLSDLLKDGKPREIMCVTCGGGIQSTVVGSVRDAVRIIEAGDRDTIAGWYVGVNPVDIPCRPMSSRRPNSADVHTLTAMLLDLDVFYPTDDPRRASTDHEMALTAQCRDRVHSQLVTTYGFPLEPMRYGTTGNGSAMVWRISELPNLPENQSMLVRAIRAVAEMVVAEFPGVNVDTSVSDAVRVRRISGTVNRRAEHPQRLCDLAVNEDVEAVTLDALTGLAAQVTEGTSGVSSRTGEIILIDAEKDAVVEALKPAWRDGYRHAAGLLQCTVLRIR